MLVRKNPRGYGHTNMNALPGRCPKCDGRIVLWMVEGAWHWGAVDAPWYPHGCLKSHVTRSEPKGSPKPLTAAQADEERTRLYRETAERLEGELAVLVEQQRRDDRPRVSFRGAYSLDTSLHDEGNSRLDRLGNAWDDPTAEAALTEDVS